MLSNGHSGETSRRGSIEDARAVPADGSIGRRGGPWRKNSVLAMGVREQPIFAKGRARAETVSREPRVGRVSAQPSPATETPPRVGSKKGKEALSPKSAKKKVRDEDLVVPPINVLIVEGESLAEDRG
jgi:hypothetical protein